MQGLTLNQIVINLKGGRFTPGKTYVALSSVKSINQLYLLNFHPSSIKKSVKVEEEMTRLRNHSTMPLYESNKNEHNLLISYLNVCSYKAKLPDLILDPILQSSDIICFTETWLSPHKPFQFFKPNNVTFRCDRSILNAKGGVLTSTQQDFKIIQYQSSTNGKYEYLIIKLQLLETLLISITNIILSITNFPL